MYVNINVTCNILQTLEIRENIRDKKLSVEHTHHKEIITSNRELYI